MNAVQTNDRGEFTDAAGKLYHNVQTLNRPDTIPTTVVHEGAWLNCDGCNPVVVVQVSQNTGPKDQLTALRAEYAVAKAAEKDAKERAETATSKLKAALTEASGGALRSSLHVPGFKPLNLTYSEPWSVPAADLKAKYPAVYVELAQKGQRWTLAESRGA